MSETETKVVNPQRKEAITQFINKNKLGQAAYYIQQVASLDNFVVYLGSLLVVVINTWFVSATDLSFLTYVTFGLLEVYLLSLLLSLFGAGKVEDSKISESIDKLSSYLASFQTKEVPAEHKEKVDELKKNPLFQPLLVTIVLVSIAIVTTLFSNTTTAVLSIIFVFGAPVAVKFGLVTMAKKTYTEVIKPQAEKVYEEKIKPAIEEAKAKKAGEAAPVSADTSESTTE
ncbi:hypothetical protein BLNAU_4506 [Blattamonas nauphoetae]|uniref:Uncharacterized protein n=1 Tax=Blattamonas nauphoetae TaxID=2049346 RepID=A0ABQ9YA82_9EUKA|nr:hypothetical protein BLNAU_4506 [Blattamonas nauphoetae]